MNSPSIDVVGADANNLKYVDVRFPLERISVVTGVSGSGKSSLLADTLAAEGAWRSRTFLGISQQELERDDVRAFIGAIPPTVLVGQRGFRPNVRTTLATATGFLSVLRRLFVLASVPYSEPARAPVPRPSAESYAGWIAQHYRGLAEIWAVPVRDSKTDGVAAVERLAANGIQRATIRSRTDPPRLRESGRVIETRAFKGLSPNVQRSVEALVGELQVSGASKAEPLGALLELAFKAGGGGGVVVMLPDTTEISLAGPFGARLDSERHWVHPEDPAVYAEPSPHLLSFNAPDHQESGACPVCRGTGVGKQLREGALVRRPDLSMRDGAFAIWTPKNYKYVNVQHETIEGLRGLRGFSPDVPWCKLPESARALVLKGSGEELVFDIGPSGRKFGKGRPFPGFRKLILEKSSGTTKIARQLVPYVKSGPCEACGGTRWSFQARSLRVGGRGIAELLGMTFSEVEMIATPHGEFARSVLRKARPLAASVHRHAHSITSVGLGYLTGDRGMLDVSEGESRRIRLARILEAEESGFCFLLDEPARGLHEADLPRLVSALKQLRGEHTVIINEHRERISDAADWFVEIGPGGGASGGKVVYAGPESRREGDGDRCLPPPVPLTVNDPNITILGASIHNIDNLDCKIPLGRLTCIGGVSGSGKSSFVRGVLAPALLESIGGEEPSFALPGGQWRSVAGHGQIKEVVVLDQGMPPPNRRSLVATFTGVFDQIRRILASTPAAKRASLSASDFSVNTGNGRCPTCVGVGEVENHGVWSVCPACGGTRYGHAALSVRFAGLNAQELLETPASQIGDIADSFRISHSLIDAMCDLGIGYLTLGRRVDSLSGGELQRLRLAMRLGAVAAVPTLFILDEPAVGLHPHDVGKVERGLERALEGGRNTVVIVEHNIRLIRSSDWVLEFGPGSGPEGGQIIFAGTPEQLVKKSTPTGLALAGKLTTRKKQRQTSRPRVGDSKISLGEREGHAKSLLKALIDGDATDATRSSRDASGPVVVISEQFWSGRDSWEIAGLDYEIPKLLLDVQRASGADPFAEALAKWEDKQGCWVAIQPFLTEMQVWGANLPKSVTERVSSHVVQEGMELVTTAGEEVSRVIDVRHVRATGERFEPDDSSAEARLNVLRDAFAVGAQYVELRDGKGRLLATATDRLLDLDASLVAPILPLPPHFSRLDTRGQCTMCQGKGAVTVVDQSLVIGDPRAAPGTERFLTSEARAVLKGVERNELRPFLRRLAKEGLWDLDKPFERLNSSERAMILFGFWSRPGAGSFLKKPSGDPTVVASWLRWDGLHRRVVEQADRSRNVHWAHRVKKSTRMQACRRCRRSGLQPYAELLRVGDISFVEWTVSGNPDRMLQALRSVKTTTPRQRRTKKRVLSCLAPLKAGGTTKSATVVKRAVRLFTTLEPVDAAID